MKNIVNTLWNYLVPIAIVLAVVLLFTLVVAWGIGSGELSCCQGES